MRAKWGWAAVFVVAAIIATALAWQHRETRSLQAEFARLRDPTDELVKLRAENQRLLALQMPAVALENLRADHHAVARLRTEIAALRAQAEANAKAAREAGPTPARFATGSVVPAADWKNAGAATPAAALETVLWAAAGGDVDAFAAMLMIETGKTLPAARALLATLPDSMRASYGTPERLIAFLAIKDVPLGAARVRQWSGEPADRLAQSRLVLTAPDGKAKEASLVFMRQGDDWKLTVLEGVVAKYAAQLKGEAATAK